jgi:predicted 3-demethylubiquinone-9 3-methyltransferase (glyoxalase superfamily)
VIPTPMIEMMNDPDPERSSRVMSAMMKMKKLDLDELRRARGE